jgi:hypothetical protein
MVDLTIIYLTLNELSEAWQEYQMGHLLKATEGYPIISISRKPMDLGINILQKEKRSYWNIYKQLLRGALLAETKYIGVAEDDTLYSKEHFNEYRPPDGVAGYNLARWSVFTWAEVYSRLARRGNFAMIAPRDLVISAITERNEKHPKGNTVVGEIGKARVERRLGVVVNKSETWESSVPVINLCHREGLSHGKVRGRRKKYGKMKAYDIPHWGKVTDILRIANG